MRTGFSFWISSFPHDPFSFDEFDNGDTFEKTIRERSALRALRPYSIFLKPDKYLQRWQHADGARIIHRAMTYIHVQQPLEMHKGNYSSCRALLDTGACIDANCQPSTERWVKENGWHKEFSPAKGRTCTAHTIIFHSCLWILSIRYVIVVRDDKVSRIAKAWRAKAGAPWYRLLPRSKRNKKCWNCRLSSFPCPNKMSSSIFF